MQKSSFHEEVPSGESSEYWTWVAGLAIMTNCANALWIPLRYGVGLAWMYFDNEKRILIDASPSSFR
jgi:hypothetical protein